MAAQHPLRGDVAVLVPAAGLGTRLGPGAPKALRGLGGASLLVHAVRRLAQAPSVGCIVVAAPPGRAEQMRPELAAEVTPDVILVVVEGGATRRDSVAAALAALPSVAADTMSFPFVLVHDAARALAPAELVERVAAAVRAGHDAVIPVLPVVDTVKRVDGSGHVIATVDRTQLRAVQTPQGFRREVLQAAHRGAASPDAATPEPAADALTDDAGLVERIGVRVFCVPGSEHAMKITMPADLALAELLLRAGA